MDSLQRILNSLSIEIWESTAHSLKCDRTWQCEEYQLARPSITHGTGSHFGTQWLLGN